MVSPTPAALARFRISPRAAALAKESVIDPHAITGSGPEGRIVEKDVKAYLEANDYASLRASPAAKALAAKDGLDLIALSADNGGKRIEVADVERAVAEKPKPMSKMRQVIAQRLTQSVVTAPHFYVTVEVDMTETLAHRARLNGAGARYSVTDFIAQASILALKEFPAVNSATDGGSVRWHSRVHLGIAVTLDQGLVVPVIRDAGEMTMVELSQRAKALIDKARAGGLSPDEMSGSTFSISNMGMLDVEAFTAIINPGESAILAVSSTIKKPVVRGDAIVARPIMKMTLSSDHRLIDGATAARFVNSIKTKLEDNGLWSALTS
jgi:pyruvate dehydrogenase E2 component (dihydrolipoamide acetyltransferase)